MKKILILFFSFFCFFSVNAEEEIINLINTKLDEIGKFELPQSYPEGLVNSTLKKCEIDNYRCIKTKAISEMVTRFKRSKKYNDRNPGSQVYAMALYEIYYLSKLKESQNSLRIFKENWPEKIVNGKKISSLIKNNETRKIMREAVGITIDQSPEEAIKIFWIIGDYLQKGKPKTVNVDKAFKKRERLLSEYKSTIGFLKKRIEKKKINKLYEYLEKLI
tara:strand:- start:2259 stop:2915 length:657 start_codon:yes stop_codon:yes gene_type:complete